LARAGFLVEVVRSSAHYSFSASTSTEWVVIPNETSGAGASIHALAGAGILVVESSHIVFASIATVLVLEH